MVEKPSQSVTGGPVHCLPWTVRYPALLTALATCSHEGRSLRCLVNLTSFGPICREGNSVANRGSLLVFAARSTIPSQRLVLPQQWRQP